MCIIVDINAFPDVFVPSSVGYPHFSHVGKHIRSGKSRLIIGGTKFLGELKYLVILNELKNADQLRIADKSIVDALQVEIERRIYDPAFNDQHIVALSCVTRTKLVVTKDVNLQRHLRAREFYNSGIARPNIYNERSPTSLIPPGNFSGQCLLCR